MCSALRHYQLPPQENTVKKRINENPIHKTAKSKLVVEESDARERHGHAVLIARRDHLLVGHGPSRLRNIRHAHLCKRGTTSQRCEQTKKGRAG